MKAQTTLLPLFVCALLPLTECLPVHKQVTDSPSETVSDEKKHERIRKEYRTLSDEERYRFQDAMHRLKTDLLPGGTAKFDAIAKLHTGETLIVAHGGPGFLTWHRQYLLIIEDALREYDPDVAIPYWDSTLDNGLDNPIHSIMWHDEFMGSGRGEVSSGSFADWRSPHARITRNISAIGRLITHDDVNLILAQETIANITRPNGAQEHNIEIIHGYVHDWVGGHMGSLDTASFDPLFYMHHAFIDCLYEEFRDLQMSRGLDPGSDWPLMYGAEHHARNAKISISDTMTHIDMAKDDAKKIYTCARRPSCVNSDDQCGSQYLQCDMIKQTCVSRTLSL